MEAIHQQLLTVCYEVSGQSYDLAATSIPLVAPEATPLLPLVDSPADSRPAQRDVIVDESTFTFENSAGQIFSCGRQLQFSCLTSSAGDKRADR